MSRTLSSPAWRELALALGGPALLGAAFALHGGLIGVASSALALPAALAATAVLMLPALYIATAIVGSAPPAARLGRQALYVMSRIGLFALCCAPAVAFLTVSFGERFAITALAHLVIAGALTLGLWRLWRQTLSGGAHVHKSAIVFAGWAFVGLGIGWRLWIELSMSI